MRLSSKSEYAFLALIDLAVKYDGGYIKMAEIAARHSIPKKYLEQIMLLLKGGGYVKSRMGAEGGFKLSRAPEKITLAEIVRSLDGALAPVLSVSEHFYDATPVEQSPELIRILADIRRYTVSVLEAATLRDLIPASSSSLQVQQG